MFIMYNVYFVTLYLPLLFNFVTVLQFDTLDETVVEGDECILKDSGQRGLCIGVDNCDYAKELLKKRQRPQHCGGFVFQKFPIVCCPKPKSEKKCVDYFGVYRFSLLVHNGNQSLAKEFPHMAVLGYGDKENIDWSCGGSLISEEFVLTAAHCINSRELGSVKWIRLGDLDLKNTTDDAKPQDFTISKIHIHPKYKAPSHYHDIALIQLDRKAVFDDYVKPACLHTEKSAPSQLTITGWGTVDYVGEKSTHLLKAFLNQIDLKICTKTYETISKRRLPSGILDDLQICAGHPEGQDTCPGDSGGPLQYVVHNGPRPYFKVVGVTSFGKGCGLKNSVGVYTRVSNYRQWIEDIVWTE